MTAKEASIKYGFQEVELRELKRKGILHVDSKNKYDENELQKYFEEFWDEHISRTEMNNIYVIRGTRFTRLLKDSIIIPKGKYYDRKSFMEFVEQEKKK
jgi:hypothetical protein